MVKCKQASPACDLSNICSFEYIIFIITKTNAAMVHCYFDIVDYFSAKIKMGLRIEAHLKFHSSRQMDTEFHSTFPLELLPILSIQLFGDTV